MAKPLAAAKQAPKLNVKTPVPRVAGAVEPDAPTNTSYRNQVAKLTQLGYERGEAEKIVDEQFSVQPPPLAFKKGGLVGSKKTKSKPAKARISKKAVK